MSSAEPTTGCPRCGRSNDRDNRFCGRCGLDLQANAAHGSNAGAANAEGAQSYCYRHPKVATNLSCGRCERPICTKCAVIGPAGPRCPECAKHNIAFRPAGALHSVKSSARGLGRLGPYGIYILVIAAVSLFGALRSCGAPQPRQRVPIERIQDEDDGSPASNDVDVRV